MIAAVPGQIAERRDPADLGRAETIDKGHGRIEIRRIQVRTKLPARLDQEWPGLKAICRIERIRELKDRCSREVIYAITSLDPATHGSTILLQLFRDHWQIENTLFHVRDITFREDHCRVRTGSAPHALAAIRDATPKLDQENPANAPPRPRSLRRAEVEGHPTRKNLMN